MVVLVNRAKMTTSTTGTGTITLGSVVDGYQTFAAAGVSNGDSVRYVIEDGTSNWEIGSGTYTASGTTLSRNPSESSDGGSAITLSGDAIVFISAIASDIQPITYVTTTFTATAAQTTFTVSYTAGLVEVFLNGAKLSGADFTATNGTSIVLASGANVGDTVDVIAYGTVSIANTYTQAQADALFVDVAGDTMTGGLNITSGNLGVGTSSPVRPLSVKASQEQLTLSEGDLRGATFDYQSSTGALHISTNGANARTSPQLTLDLNGNVGIGTSSPAKQMHIESSTGGTLRLSSSDASVGAGESLGQIDWYSNDASGSGSGVRAFVNVVENDGGLGRAYDMTFGTGQVATATERMRIDSSGNVGIGSSAPGMLLEVDASSGSANDIARFSGRNSGGLTFRNATANEFILHTATSDALIFGTNGNNERMRIDSSGNVGIGTSSVTSGFKLDVVGDARFSDVAGEDGVELGWSSGGSQGFVQAYDRGASAFRNLNLNGAVTITSTGNVGIGTSSPAHKLDVAGGMIADSYNETYVSLSGTSPAVDCSTGNVFALSTTGNTTFTFTNPPTSGTGYGFILKLTAGGTHTVSWPASVDWAAATAPDAPASGETDVLGFLTYDGGTTWYGFLAGDAMG